MMMTIIDDNIKKYYEEFEQLYAPYQGWINPFVKDREIEKIENKKWYSEGMPQVELATQSEKEFWLYERDKYIMNKLCANAGFEAAKTWVLQSYCSVALLKDLYCKKACEYNNGQCLLDCASYGMCGKED